MKSPIGHLIELLYGRAEAGAVGSEVRALMERFSSSRATSTMGALYRPLSERDTLLITYADQLRQPGRAPLEALAGFCESHLRDAVSGVHILPFYPSSSDDGFSVKDYFNVDSDFGTWDHIVQLGRSFDLMFDGVFNHLSAQGDWFRRFQRDQPEYRDFFLTVRGNPDLRQVVRPRALPLLTEFATARGPEQVWTTFSADQVDLDYRNPRVLLAILKALLFYVEKGARFVRLDAIAFLWKEIGTSCVHLPQTHAIVQLLRAVLAEVAPHVFLITETNVPHADNLSYFGDGTNEAQLVYNFALPPLVLHSFLTGSAGTLARWARSLRLPSEQVTFFNFLASHDGIGLNPARGILSESEIDGLVRHARECGGLVSLKQNPDGSQSPYELNITWFDALNGVGSEDSAEMQVDRFITSQAIMLALAGLPGLYFHSLFGSRNDRRGVERSGISRRINRQKLDRLELEQELASPATLRARVFSRYRDLLKRRRGCAAFHPQGRQEILDVDDRLFCVLRTSPAGSQRVLCAHNVSKQSIDIDVPDGLGSGRLSTLLEPPGSNSSNRGGRLHLGPYQFLWFKRTEDSASEA